MWLGWFLACTAPTPPVPAVPAAEALGPDSLPQKREPEPRAPTEARYAATALLVAYAGAADAPTNVTRSREEALSKARSLQARARAGADVAELAATESDALRARRGAVTVWATGVMEPAFEWAIAAVEPGEIAPIADTPQGYWVARRDPVEVRRIGQILVSYQGAWKNPAGRTRAQAESRAAEALRRVEAGEPFGEVAAALSDAGKAGADLGLLGRNQLIPAVEAAAWPLEVGAHTAVVESPHGLHVLIRLE